MNLALWFVRLAGPWVIQALKEVGIGFVTYEIMSTILDNMIGVAMSNFSLIDSSTAAFLAMSGVTNALGIISGALVARVARMSSKKLSVLK